MFPLILNAQLTNLTMTVDPNTVKSSPIIKPTMPTNLSKLSINGLIPHRNFSWPTSSLLPSFHGNPYRCIDGDGDNGPCSFTNPSMPSSSFFAYGHGNARRNPSYKLFHRQVKLSSAAVIQHLTKPQQLYISSRNVDVHAWQTQQYNIIPIFRMNYYDTNLGSNNQLNYCPNNKTYIYFDLLDINRYDPLENK